MAGGGLNKLMAIGNVGKEPEIRYTQSGAAVCNFSIAVNRRWTSPDNEVHDEVEWINVVAWNKLAEVCGQLVTKGRKVYVEGRLQTRSWEGQDGVKKYRTEVIAQTMLLLDAKPQGQAVAAGSGDAGWASDEVEIEDLPFAPSCV